jgi:hypothetical protein
MLGEAYLFIYLFGKEIGRENQGRKIHIQKGSRRNDHNILDYPKGGNKRNDSKELLLTPVVRSRVLTWEVKVQPTFLLYSLM